MVSLKKNKLKCHIYRDAVEMAGVDGKPKQVWQKYLGTAEKSVELKERAAELPHIKLRPVQYGKPPRPSPYPMNLTSSTS